MATAPKRKKPFAASEPFSDAEVRELEKAKKRSEARRKKDFDKDSELTRERRAMQELREMEQDTLSTTPEEMIEEMKRERNMRRGEASVRGYKKGGMVTPRGQGKVMRSRKTRMC